MSLLISLLLNWPNKSLKNVLVEKCSSRKHGLVASPVPSVSNRWIERRFEQTDKKTDRQFVYPLFIRFRIKSDGHSRHIPLPLFQT